MPRIDAIRVLRLWVAFNVNDWGEYNHVAVGWTREHACLRSLRKID